jgi:sugar lactone lactonase YvrE
LLNRPASADPTGAGVQVSHTPSPNIVYVGGNKIKVSGNEIYVADPAIEKLPNGYYIMAHSLFGAGTNANSPVSKIFRSTDNGKTWALMKQLDGFQRGSFFVHDNVLYLIGAQVTGTSSNGDAAFSVAILKSTDNGATWSTPTDANNGILIGGNTGTTKTPQLYNNRVWISLGTDRALSAPLSSDLMKAASWTRSAPGAAKTEAAIAKWPAPVSLHFGGTGGVWTEAQIVASPAHGVTVMPKIQFNSPDAVPHTALFHISADGKTMTFDPAKDFVPLTGTQKKFGATYDAISGRYYALTNTVLHADKDVIDPNSQQVKHELIRNTATLISSADLYHWDVEKIVLHARDAEHTAWQYITFIVDGNDLAIASRTAFKTAADQYKPPRGHDSNLLTFHRLEAFRAITPAHYLKIEGGTVNRYETTHYEDAPLGNFAIGHAFAGAPDGLAQAADGTVYVRESNGGIIKSFDAHGNYLGPVSALPAGAAFTGSDTETLAISQPPSGSRNWTATAGGDWYDPRNWYYWNYPDTELETATFGTSIAAAATVTLARPCTLGALHFRSPHACTIAQGSLKSSDGTATYGTGALTLKAASGRPALAVHQGRHTLAVPLALPVESDFSIAADSALTIDHTLVFQATINLDIAFGATAPAGAPLTLKAATKNGTGALIKINLTGITAATPAGTKVITITGAHNLAAADFEVSADVPVIHTFANNTLSITPASAPANPVAPSNAAMTEGHHAGVVTMTASAQGAPAPAYQWQVLKPGGVWQNLTAADAARHSGMTTAVLTITNPLFNMNGWQYRYIAGNGVGDPAISAAATLTVAPDAFPYPTGLVLDASETIYVADAISHTIQKISPRHNEVSILSGLSDQAGATDGTDAGARFDRPHGVKISTGDDARDGGIHVADTANKSIRRVTADGVVTTLTGASAGLASPWAVAIDNNGNTYVTDAVDNCIRMIAPDGTVSVIADAGAGFSAPAGIAVDAEGWLYVADTGRHAIRAIAPGTREVTLLAGVSGTAGGADGPASGARFRSPGGMAVDGVLCSGARDGSLYIADTGNSLIRELTGGTVRTLAGRLGTDGGAGIPGYRDGAGTAAWLDSPLDIAIAANGDLYVADTGNAAIRKIAFDDTGRAVVSTLTPSPAPASAPPASPDSGGGGSGGSGAGAHSTAFPLLLLLAAAVARHVRGRE